MGLCPGRRNCTGQPQRRPASAGAVFLAKRCGAPSRSTSQCVAAAPWSQLFAKAVSASVELLSDLARAGHLPSVCPDNLALHTCAPAPMTVTLPETVSCGETGKGATQLCDHPSPAPRAACWRAPCTQVPAQPGPASLSSGLSCSCRREPRGPQCLGDSSVQVNYGLRMQPLPVRCCVVQPFILEQF